MNNLESGIYIPNIEACWLYKANNSETKNYEIDYEYLDKLLNGKLDYSFELVENKELLEGIEIKEVDGKLYTLDIVNVKYTKKYKVANEEKTTKQLRDWTYIDGFKFNGNLMTNFKRASGKARIGENLFILETIKNVIDWARMGLEFKSDCDIAGIRAYESLPLSSIIGCVKINPNSILVIDDHISEFNWTMSNTWLENGELKTETIPTKEKDSIWDGEGLLSSKIFDENEVIKGRGVALLRNRYMKCAGFCCYIEKYYRKYCKDNCLEYETYEVEDMYGNKILVKDILLITTPSAIKLSKYNNEVLKIDGYKGEDAWLKYWKDNCGETFGVCKTDKPSHFENGLINRLSYQMINTIPFTPEQISDLVKPEIEYVNRLKDDLDFFLQEVNQYSEEIKEIGEDYDTNEEDDNDNVLDIGRNIDVTGAFLELIKTNPQFQNTQVFKDFRRNYINAYITQVRQGKIKIESDYCVACGNPFELLKATVSQFDGTSELKGNELYCSRFDDGDDIIGFRNPHINVSNIGIQVNKEVKDLKEYFNCTPNIVFLNSIDYPILSTYQGEDFDIDSNLLTKNKIIVDACKMIDKEATPIPINKIENTGSNNAELTGQKMSDIDHKISKNYIGSVINLSQEINSLYNHLKYNKEATEEELYELYQKTSRLSSMSQCEIDKAKKQFEKLNVPKELERMKKGLKLVDNEKVIQIKSEIETLKQELTIAKGNEIDEVKSRISVKYEELKKYDSRRIKPYFFKFIGDNASKKQRKATNKKHRKDLDQPIILKYCADNGIDIKDLDKENKDLVKLLKVNDKIQKEWEEKIYIKMDTPMDWLEEEMDKVKNGKKIGTTQVIKLVKKNKHKANDEVVSYVVKNIKNLDKKIKAYKLDCDLAAKDKLEKIRSVKKEVVNNILYIKLTKADLYGVMKMCLNSVKKNGEIDKRSGIESITLEVLFQVYGDGLLNMFVK
ncbi:hypothetical protein [Desulfitobacterium metallireducens]|uniref:Uncharacterized protein n=1 Tax=Desulfitobacterium metallireducens DSM 15288 TaxID=871968 RepID=W0ECF1_9FIRM|nr:hypothetical protein [Desulfitobacterium metallireducens]AHF07173.1 hypothetical protein DESME_09005 [Desulfitobacterium metallireducens DSM 15288]